MNILARRRIVESVRAQKSAGMTVKQIKLALAAGDPPFPSEEVDDALQAALDRGEIVRVDTRRLVAIEYSDSFAGTVRLTSRGFGVVRIDDGVDLEPIVIPPERLGRALDGDRVLVRRGMVRRRGRAVPDKYGEVAAVLTRRRSTIVGRYSESAGTAWVEPFARRLNMKVKLAKVDSPRPREGEFVEVALDESLPDGVVGGRIISRFGVMGEAGVDEEVILRDLGIPVAFDPAVLREAERLPDHVLAEDMKGRTDLRDQPAVTIDGETAKDFDDAVFARPGRDGSIEVFVHIADVSHYVRPGSALDRAALERGTSVYLPGRAIPMLPESLSNNLCSLVPDQDRLVFSVRFLVTENGAVEGYKAQRAVFRSRRRCTYSEVYEWVEKGSWPATLPAGVRESLELLDTAAARLGERRRERGAIDFDLPEPEILIDPDGFMTGIRAVERNRAHRLIENLMIAANECVARLLVWGRQPGMFRIHERPTASRLAELDVVLGEFGLELKGNLEELPPKEIQRILDEIGGRPEERFLQALVLRSLARASYLPECRGHYALATDFYLHFTSPIRRYPDLLVHRYLGELVAGRTLGGVDRELALAALADQAPHCSMTERRAEEAEREIVKWKQAEFMRAHVGAEFDGFVSGVVAFGLFVQLSDVYAEGLIHVSALGDDRYRYDEVGHRLVGERQRRVFRLGDGVRVRVRGVDEEFMEVDLELVSGGSIGGAERPSTQARARRPKESAPPRPKRKPPGARRGRRRR